MGIFFLENGGKNIPEVHLLFFSRPGMVDGPLDHSLETDGLLQDIFFLGIDLGQVDLGLQYRFGLANLNPIDIDGAELRQQTLSLNAGYKF